MKKAPKRPGRAKPVVHKDTSAVNEPGAVYTRKAPAKAAPMRPKQQGYDAKHSSGMLPGIAKRMKEYLRSMRDDR